MGLPARPPSVACVHGLSRSVYLACLLIFFVLSSFHFLVFTLMKGSRHRTGRSSFCTRITRKIYLSAWWKLESLLSVCPLLRGQPDFLRESVAWMQVIGHRSGLQCFLLSCNICNRIRWFLLPLGFRRTRLRQRKRVITKEEIGGCYW